MTSFAICEPTPGKNTAAFATALMKNWLRFSFSDTLFVDKVSAFLGVFAGTASLLQMNIYVLSGKTMIL